MLRLELVTELLSSLLFLLHCSVSPCALMAPSSTSPDLYHVQEATGAGPNCLLAFL